MRISRLALCALIIAACSESTGPELPSGTFNLVSVNGVALPAPAPGNGLGWFYVSGTLTLGIPDYPARWYFRNQLRRPSLGVEDTEGVPGGTFAVSGNSITFTQLAAVGFPSLNLAGTMNANTITFVFVGRTYRYEK